MPPVSDTQRARDFNSSHLIRPASGSCESRRSPTAAGLTERSGPLSVGSRRGARQAWHATCETVVRREPSRRNWTAPRSLRQR